MLERDAPARRRPRPPRPPSAPSWLDRARTIGDPTADVVVARVARADDTADVDALLARIQTTDSPMPAALPPPLRAFLDDEGLPAFADRARILRAQRFAEKHAVAITTALFCASLPMAFTGAKGVDVLRATGRIASDVDRRVNETGRFVFDVLMPGGFESGRAVRSAQKVRLLHAAVRYRVLSAKRRASTATGGDVPINQEDLLGTLAAFSVVVLDAIARMGVAVPTDDAEDFFHLWRVTGSLLGIRHEWLPRDVASARALGEHIRARQSVASPTGRELARILVDGIERHLPARGLGLVAPGLMRFLLGDEPARVLGLPEGARADDLARLVPAVSSLAQRASASGIGGLLPMLGRSALEMWMRHKLGPGGAPLFESPLAAATCPHAATRPDAGAHGGAARRRGKGSPRRS